MKTSIAEPSSLKNEHNTLFLSLLERITYLNEQHQQKLARQKTQSKESETSEDSFDKHLSN